MNIEVRTECSVTRFPNTIKMIENIYSSDVRKLARDFIGFDVAKMITNCIELGHIANNIVPIRQRWSMEKLVNQFVSHQPNIRQYQEYNTSHIETMKFHLLLLL